jgi:small basic protein
MVFISVLAVLGALASLPCLRAMISKIIRVQISGFFFNGLVASLQIAYITTVILGIASL